MMKRGQLECRFLTEADIRKVQKAVVGEAEYCMSGFRTFLDKTNVDTEHANSIIAVSDTNNAIISAFVEEINNNFDEVGCALMECCFF